MKSTVNYPGHFGTSWLPLPGLCCGWIWGRMLDESTDVLLLPPASQNACTVICCPAWTTYHGEMDFPLSIDFLYHPKYVWHFQPLDYNSQVIGESKYHLNTLFFCEYVCIMKMWRNLCPLERKCLCFYKSILIHECGHVCHLILPMFFCSVNDMKSAY